MEAIKNKNTEYLASLGIKVPEHLPLIESLDGVSPRSSSNVASRLCAMAYVVGLGFDANGSELIVQIEKYNLMQFVSDYEKELLEKKSIESQDKINMTWLTESAQSLAWCIGLVELDHFTHCDDDLAEQIPFKFDPTDFIANSKLRSIQEIQEQVDLLYRMHWYARNCNLVGKECEFSESIVSERRKAIDWAYGVEENWDEVPSDT